MKKKHTPKPEKSKRSNQSSHTHTSCSVVIKRDAKKVKVTLDKVVCKNAQGQALAGVGVDRTLLVVVKRLQTVNNCPAPTLCELFECVVRVCLPHRFQPRMKLLQALFLSCNFIQLLFALLHKAMSFFSCFSSLVLASFA